MAVTNVIERKGVLWLTVSKGSFRGLLACCSGLVPAQYITVGVQEGESEQKDWEGLQSQYLLKGTLWGLTLLPLDPSTLCVCL